MLGLETTIFQIQNNHRPGKSNIADSFSRLKKLGYKTFFDEQCESNVYSIIENTIPSALTLVYNC